MCGNKLSNQIEPGLLTVLSISIAILNNSV